MTPRRWQWLGVALGSAAFALAVLDLAFRGPVSRMDQGIYDRITAWDEAGWPVHAWSEALTKVTGTLAAAVITTGVVAWWWARGDRRLALWGAGAGLAALAAITVLKQSFRRELTPLAQGAWYGFSFPSGHTIGAAANTGLLILLAAQRRIDRLGLQGRAARATWAAAVWAWAALVVLAGVGRVLTQKHWASDVVASWGVGVALACGVLLLARIPSPPAGGAVTPEAVPSGP